MLIDYIPVGIFYAADGKGLVVDAFIAESSNSTSHFQGRDTFGQSSQGQRGTGIQHRPGFD